MSSIITNPNSTHLTSIDPEFDRCVKQTHAGMAHFAGTGPAGTTCGACSHWTGGPYAGTAVCREFWRRVGRAPTKKGNRVPRDTASCNAFMEAKP